MGKLVAYHLPGAWRLVSVSPFCLKLDADLKGQSPFKVGLGRLDGVTAQSC